MTATKSRTLGNIFGSSRSSRVTGISASNAFFRISRAVSGSPVSVAGWSAGANLATVVSRLARDNCGPAIGGQLLLAPVTDTDMTRRSYHENGERYVLTKPIMPQLDAIKVKVDRFVKLNQKHGTTLMYHTRAGANSVGSVVWDLLYVMKDGASAVYGSDGVSGVVNFILLNGPGEKPYEGAELYALYGNTTEADAHVRQVYLRGGVTGLE